MHISEKVNKLLLENDWKLEYHADGSFKAKKTMKFDALAGTVTDGTRNVTVGVDRSGRWMTTYDGWGKVIEDVDLREFQEAEPALEKLVKSSYA